MQKVICDAGCKQEFVLIEIGTARIRDDIEAVGFTCPYCGKFYGYYQSDAIKRMQKEQQKLLRAANPSRHKTKESLQRALKRIQLTKAAIKSAMDRLRAEVEGDNYAEN